MDAEYLKMVLALPDEFFKGWLWCAGDKALVNNEIYTVFGGNTNGMVVVNENIQQFSVGKLDFSYTIGDKARPIPSQEQLQKMLIDFENKYNSHNNSNYFSISERFIAVVIEGDLIENIENKTLDEMWLEFAMYLILDKVWDGEKWI